MTDGSDNYPDTGDPNELLPFCQEGQVEIFRVPPEHAGPRLSTHPIARRRRNAVEIPGHHQKLRRPLECLTLVRGLQPETGLTRVSGRCC
jgi:hypothetical protein